MPTIISIIRAILVSKYVKPILYTVCSRDRLFDAMTRDRAFTVDGRDRTFEAMTRDRVFIRDAN